MTPEHETFDAFLKRRELASADYINGDPQPLLAISAQSGDATFFPPNGKYVRGADAVNAANVAGAGSFGKGSTGHFEIFQSHSAADIGFWTGLQHAEAVLAGKDKPVPMLLRVTEIFRRVEGEWKLIHRHADPVQD